MSTLQSNDRESQIKVFIGYDSKEIIAYSVLSHSIIAKARRPVTLSPVKLDQLHPAFSRQRDPKQSTEFSFSRFMVPWLCDYTGWALFMDCDMLCLDDISELWNLKDHKYAIMVVKHNYVPRSDKKFLGNVQSAYPKKNWSSLMLMNCARCSRLTPEYVCSATGLELHQFKWLSSEAEIGELPGNWNYLVGENETSLQPKMLHFTLGGPWWQEFNFGKWAEAWYDAKEEMLQCAGAY